MKTDTERTIGKMRGGIRRRGDAFEYVIDLGRQPAQRCPACKAAKRSPTRWWIGRRQLEACPKCGGELVVTRERREQTKGGYETEKEAKRARADVLSAMGKGTHVRPDKITVGEWYGEEWQPTKKDGTPLARGTLASYKSHVRNHILGTPIASVPLQELSRERLKAHFAYLRSEGRCDGEDKPLGPRTQRGILATISKGLSDAVESRLLPYNPAARLPLPQAAKPRRTAWCKAQVQQFLASAKDDELATLWVFMATTGVRRGEALSLRWSDLDYDAATVEIRTAVSQVAKVVAEGETKTAGSVRTLPLPAATAAALKRHATEQKRAHLARGVRWQTTGLVFANEAGEWLSPSTVSGCFVKAVKRSGLPTLSLHGLRHSWGSIAIVEDGVDIVTVSHQLGHTKVTTTLNVYSHALEHQSRQAAQAVAAGMVPADF